MPEETKGRTEKDCYDYAMHKTNKTFPDTPEYTERRKAFFQQLYDNEIFRAGLHVVEKVEEVAEEVAEVVEDVVEIVETVAGD